MKTIEIDSVEELSKVAEEVISSLNGRNVVALYGPMGAGKTTLVTAIMQYLHSDDIVTSPTFALVNQYRTPEFGDVYHFDFYRINSLAEAFDIGYEEYFDSGNLCLVEWPEKIEELLPDDVVVVKIELEEETRQFLIY